MKPEPGTRTFAVRNANKNTIWIFGYGTYVGDHPRPGTDVLDEGDIAIAEQAIRDRDADPIDVRPFYDKLVADGDMTQEEADTACAEGQAKYAATQARPLRERAEELVRGMNLNPKIELDNGGVVWGYQCWWMPEHKAEEYIAGREVVVVDSAI